MSEPVPIPAFPRTLRSHVPAGVGFIGLTVLLTFPIVAAMGHAIPGWEGDNLYYVRSMWWMKHALFDLHISPFFDPTAYFPAGQIVSRSEMSAANTILGLPITAIWGPVAAYNAMLLFSFVATGLGTYFWVTHLTGRRTAGFVAGTIAAFAPLRFAHLPGHLPQMTTEWIPWTLFALERFVTRRTIGRAVWVGITASLLVLGCWYYGFAMIILLPVYIGLRTWRDREIWRDPAWWRGLAVASIAGLVLLAPFVVQLFKLSRAGQLGRSLQEMDGWSLNVYDVFLPNLLHPSWGPAASQVFPRQRQLGVELIVSLGYVAVAAALVGLVGRAHRRIVLTLTGVWLVSYVIALGPTLHFGDHQVLVPLPDIVVRAVNHLLLPFDAKLGGLRSLLANTKHAPIVLPSFFMYLLVPFTSSMRVMARFTVWTIFMTAALAGWGTLRIEAWAERRWGAVARGAWAAAIVALVVFESYSPFGMLPLAPRPVDLWMRTQPASSVIASLPVEAGTRPLENYWATIHGRATIFSWNGDSFPPPELSIRRERLQNFPAPETIAYLHSLGVTHIFVTPQSAAQRDMMRQSLDAEPTLISEGQIGDVWVYRFR